MGTDFGRIVVVFFGVVNRLVIGVFGFFRVEVNDGISDVIKIYVFSWVGKVLRV